MKRKTIQIKHRMISRCPNNVSNHEDKFLMEGLGQLLILKHELYYYLIHTDYTYTLLNIEWGEDHYETTAFR